MISDLAGGIPDPLIIPMVWTVPIKEVGGADEEQPSVLEIESDF